MEHALPKISVVTPSLNQGRYIEQTIRSVLSQDYPNLEYIVMDGGSTDETANVLNRYRRSLQWFREPDRGQSDALNKGMGLATGEILGFINADDTYAAGSLSLVGRYFAKHPETDWLSGRCRNIGADGGEIRRSVAAYKDFWLRRKQLRLLPVLNFISQPATFWRRRVFESVGPFDENLHYAMDYDYWLRTAKLYSLDVIDVHLANFRIHPESKAGASASAQFQAAFEIVRRHVKSPALLLLHRLHAGATIATYRFLSSREHTAASTK